MDERTQPLTEMQRRIKKLSQQSADALETGQNIIFHTDDFERPTTAAAVLAGS